ncbi:MAG: nicotinate-nucleotide--dimethylbenzimidazole phosphoribosyltransferase [Nitrospirota bacterium]|nr:nicotinate-nucleotide--dimethylbenzimidazole phosphoribosyltransferase [Nitrospirota bacterium]
MSLLETTLKEIKPINPSYHEQAQSILDRQAKPQGSLGRLEEFGRRYAAIRENLNPILNKKAIFTFAGDHGVADEGVSAFPKEVTPQMVFNFLRGGAGVNVIARHVGAEVVVVDIGVDYEFEQADGLVCKKVGRGTANMAVGPAMSRDDAVKALEVGIELAQRYAGKGYDILGTGDMGIANTTPSSAIVAVFTGKTVEELTGRGTGINEAAWAHKVSVIKRSLEVNRPDPKDALDVLAKVGGYEIAGIAGLILGGASRRIPVVVDGFISTAGALVATELCPLVRDYIFMAHKSVEIGHQSALDKIGQRPFVDLDMRLGEGTGAALGINLVECGVKVLTEIASFDAAGVTEADEKLKRAH